MKQIKLSNSVFHSGGGSLLTKQTTAACQAWVNKAVLEPSYYHISGKKCTKTWVKR